MQSSKCFGLNVYAESIHFTSVLSDQRNQSFFFYFGKGVCVHKFEDVAILLHRGSSRQIQL